MNESILAAIRTKAEEKFPEFKDTANEAAYTSGYKDAIEMMLKFMEWTYYEEWYRSEIKIGKWYQKPFTEFSKYQTDIELLTKYMENENG